MTKTPNDNGYRRKNNCPYCNYNCDAASMLDDDHAVPKEGDISFCLMCVEPSVFGENMILKKFDLNSIRNTGERLRLKNMQSKMKLFWKEHPELAKEKRSKYVP